MKMYYANHSPNWFQLLIAKIFGQKVSAICGGTRVEGYSLLGALYITETSNEQT